MEKFYNYFCKLKNYSEKCILHLSTLYITNKCFIINLKHTKKRFCQLEIRTCKTLFLNVRKRKNNPPYLYHTELSSNESTT